MEEKISIQKENVLNAYKQASKEQKALIENMFGKEMFQPKDIKERVKTFEDACEVLGEDHQYVKAYREWMRISYAECKDVTAYLKLRIICAALNEGWKPTYDDAEYRYYMLLSIYREEEYELLDEDKKKECRTISKSNGTRIAYCCSVCMSSATKSFCLGPGLCPRPSFKTGALAKYCGQQFIDIWVDYLF